MSNPCGNVEGLARPKHPDLPPKSDLRSALQRDFPLGSVGVLRYLNIFFQT